MVEKIAYNFSCFIKEKNPKSRSLEVINFGMIIILNFLFTILLSFSLAQVFGILKDVIIVLISFVLIRQFAGGYHLKSCDACVIVSTILLILIPIVDAGYFKANLITDLIAVLINLIFAPITNKINFKKSPNRFAIYKLIPVLLILINAFYIQSSLISLTFFCASISLILAFVSKKLSN